MRAAFWEHESSVIAYSLGLETNRMLWSQHWQRMEPDLEFSEKGV